MYLIYTSKKCITTTKGPTSTLTYIEPLCGQILCANTFSQFNFDIFNVPFIILYQTHQKSYPLIVFAANMRPIICSTNTPYLNRKCTIVFGFTRHILRITYIHHSSIFEIFRYFTMTIEYL